MVLKEEEEEDKGEPKEMPVNTKSEFEKIKDILFDPKIMKHAANKMCHSCSKGKVSDYTYQVNPSKDSTILDKCDSCEDAPCFILKKGLFKCSNKEEECGIKICWQCMLLTVTINDFKVESLDTIPFSKDPVRLCKGSMRQCVSEKMQGNKLIPECWTTCLSKQPLKGAEKE